MLRRLEYVGPHQKKNKKKKKTKKTKQKQNKAKNKHKQTKNKTKKKEGKKALCIDPEIKLYSKSPILITEKQMPVQKPQEKEVHLKHPS